MKYLIILLSVIIIGLTSGCASHGQINGQQTNTRVSVDGNNFKIIHSNAIGHSSGFDLFGIIPFSSPAYYEAKKDLFDSTGDNFTGRSIALINQTEDRSTTYLILFSIPKLTLSADIIEYYDAEHTKK